MSSEGNGSTPPSRPPEDFSLLLGGPVYRFWRRSLLTDDALQFQHRRMAACVLLAWLPLLVLSAIQGRAWGGGGGLNFLEDAETHLRLLVALPLLIHAELFVHRRMRRVMSNFVLRDLVRGQDRARFDAAIASAMRLRNSTVAELLLLALVYVVGVGMLWRSHALPDANAWYGELANGGLKPSLSGWWFGLVSLPLFQFMLLRWYYRLLIWARLLWQLSRLDLQYLATHPDRCGGVGFLAATSFAFTPLLVAQGVALAGLMANRIFHAGATLPDFKLELMGLVGVMLLAVLGPLLPFCPRLAAAKRAAAEDYGLLADRYGREFEHKWLRGGAPAGEPLMGSADIQSLADLGNSYGAIREMRWIPFTPQVVLQLAVATLLPVAPLLLTVVPLEELLERLLKIVL